MSFKKRSYVGDLIDDKRSATCTTANGTSGQNWQQRVGIGVLRAKVAPSPECSRRTLYAALTGSESAPQLSSHSPS